jgi:hypothetical protein
VTNGLILAAQGRMMILKLFRGQNFFSEMHLDLARFGVFITLKKLYGKQEYNNHHFRGAHERMRCSMQMPGGVLMLPNSFRLCEDHCSGENSPLG